MPVSLAACARLLSAAGVRHHLDVEDAAIRVVFVTRSYTNPRGENLAIVRLEAPDGGRRVRASIARAFPCGRNPAATCAAVCGLAADTPLVGVEYDPAAKDLRIVVEFPVEDGHVTQAQLLAPLDALVEAAEAWHVALRRVAERRPRRTSHAKPHAA